VLERTRKFPVIDTTRKLIIGGENGQRQVPDPRTKEA
jgi:hypothetical protein